jgi:DNA repair exonuclease SbcCD ATPase subunit
MRLLRLQVADFGAVERADIELGPGLNVLYGPNDLGKSTLAAALRAVLLLPHASSAATRFAPWHSGRSPTVTLSFEVEGRVWRVTKSWGRGSGGSSLLEYANDGHTFSPEEKGRGVDGKLRDLLGWGIAAPGGKGGKHGLPTSFLATVLLAEQGTPYGVLDDSLLEDGTDSGRQRLIDAMAALAQHPVFKAVLDGAQEKVDEAFTATGKRKRGKDSPFTRLGEQIANRQAEFEQLRARMGEADAVSARLGELDQRRDRLMTVCADARERLDALGRDLERTQAQARARTALEAARTRLQAIRDQVAQAQRCERERTQLEAALPEARARVEASTQHRRSVEADLHTAQATVASIEAGAQTGAEHQALERRKLELQSEQLRLRAICDQASGAVSLAQDIAALEEGIASKTEELRDVQREQQRIDTEREILRARLEHISAAMRLRRLEVGQGALDALRDARAAAQHKREEARALQLEAERLGPEQTQLPDRETLERLETLSSEARLAEAALGGGLSLEVDLPGDVPLGATIDGQVWPPPVGWRTFEAERSAELRIGDVATVRVVGGDVDRRHAAEEARRRYCDAAQPVLAAAQVDDLAALQACVRQAAQLHTRAERLRAEARGLLQVADARDADDEAIASAAARVQQLTAELGEVDRGAVIAAVGDLDEAALRREEATVAQRVAQLGSEREPLAGATAQLCTQIEATTSQRDDLCTRLKTAQAALQDDPSLVADRTKAQLQAVVEGLAGVELEQAALAEARRDRAAKAQETLENVRNAVEAARTAEEAARTEVARLHERLSAVSATLELHARQLEQLDEEAAGKEVHEREAELQALPVPEHAVDAEMVEDARRRLAQEEHALDEVHDEVRKAEGALQQVGGEVVRERAAAAREALDRARREAAELELDYDAWQLLVETLREAENDEGRNLGQVLGAQVAARFSKLTQGRYGELSLSPDLKMEGLQAAGDLRSVQALSEGLKEQLATLLRISIAEQLSCALVLDDHLTQTDPARIGWFCDVLRTATKSVQVVVLTCRPSDYLRSEELDATASTRDASERVRSIDLSRVISRS